MKESSRSDMEEIRFLLVDDDISLLRLSKALLEGEDNGMKIFTSIYSNDALKLLKIDNYDLIVSDFQISNVDGIAFLEILKQQVDKTLFIVFTGRGREEIAIRDLNLGADFDIQKKVQKGVFRNY